MEYHVFQAAVSLAAEYGEYITIGGGEPTVHPRFFDYLRIANAVDTHSGIPTLVVTNGKRTAVMHKLISWVRDGLVDAYVDLSLDDFHDPINPEIEKVFMLTRKKKWNAVGIRLNNLNTRDKTDHFKKLGKLKLTISCHGERVLWIIER